jgi:pSer/pThr/pTyr-binding forkhead associated (FHA) protein
MKLELDNIDRREAPIVLTQFPVIVGVDPGADVCLDDSSVGHYQCMIDFCDGTLMVWDLGTKQGTIINGARIDRKAPLMPGDEIGIGKNRFVAHYDGVGIQQAAPDVHVSVRSPASSHRRRQPAGLS